MTGAYIIAEVTVTDEAQMVKYREWSTRAMQEFGAKVLVRGGNAKALEGAWLPQRVVVLKFKDRATAQAYNDSETYRHARQIREGAGGVDMILVDGVN
jgi:uncharacterized protein (DUF1330 family)